MNNTKNPRIHAPRPQISGSGSQSTHLRSARAERGYYNFAPKQPTLKERLARAPFSQKVISTVGAAGLALTVGYGVANLESRQTPKLPTLAEYNADPDKYPNHHIYTVKSGDTFWDISRREMPDRDERQGSDMLANQDKANLEADLSQQGLQPGDQLVVTDQPSDK